MDDVKLSDIIQDLNQKVDAVYRHGTLQERYSAIARDYGEGFVLTESEAHTLGYVCEMGEATVTDLADYSFRTKGTISKMLRGWRTKAWSKNFNGRATGSVSMYSQLSGESGQTTSIGHTIGPPPALCWQIF
ncbi:MAG: hypothetical protein ACLUES_13405 [Flavonifractor plautii]